MSNDERMPLDEKDSIEGRNRSSSLIRLNTISKAFGGVQALRDVSFELQAGAVHALVGENGAGKSTLIKVIT